MKLTLALTLNPLQFLTRFEAPPGVPDPPRLTEDMTSVVAQTPPVIETRICNVKECELCF